MINARDSLEKMLVNSTLIKWEWRLLACVRIIARLAPIVAFAYLFFADTLWRGLLIFGSSIFLSAYLQDNTSA